MVKPILKTNELGLPQDNRWKNDVVNYIIDTKAITINDIDLIYVLNNICPGQTLQSIKKFIQGQLQTDWSKQTGLNDSPLHEICDNRIIHFEDKSFDDTSHRAKQKMKRCLEILDLYNALCKTFKCHKR